GDAPNEIHPPLEDTRCTHLRARVVLVFPPSRMHCAGEVASGAERRETEGALNRAINHPLPGLPRITVRGFAGPPPLRCCFRGGGKPNDVLDNRSCMKIS